MKRFAFGRASGRPVHAYGSHGVAAHALQHDPARLVATCLWLEPGAVVGEHDAPVDQLFLVVAGSGWAAGADGVRLPLATGEAAFFLAGEVHAAGSDLGMTVVVLEGEGLTPSAFLEALGG